MITVNASREMSAPVDRIWNIVADVDNEPKYWRGTKTVKISARPRTRSSARSLSRLKTQNAVRPSCSPQKNQLK